MNMAPTQDDLDVVRMLAGETGYECVGYDETGYYFSEYGGRGRRRRMRRRKRRAKRKGFDSIRAMRKSRRRKIRKGLKKVVNNKLVRGIARGVMSIVPGGGAVMETASAIRSAVEPVVKAARKGSKIAKGGIALARAARRGDRRALGTLRDAATGRRGSLPVPESIMSRFGEDLDGFGAECGFGADFGAYADGFGGEVGAAGDDQVVVKMPSGRTYRFPEGSL